MDEDGMVDLDMLGALASNDVTAQPEDLTSAAAGLAAQERTQQELGSCLNDSQKCLKLEDVVSRVAKVPPPPSFTPP
jgi:hypothetical protein